MVAWTGFEQVAGSCKCSGPSGSKTMQGISRLDKDLLASQEALCSTDWVSYLPVFSFDIHREQSTAFNAPMKRVYGYIRNNMSLQSNIFCRPVCGVIADPSRDTSTLTQGWNWRNKQLRQKWYIRMSQPDLKFSIPKCYNIQISTIRRSITQHLFHIQWYIYQGDMFRSSRSSSGPPRKQIQEFFSFSALWDPKCSQVLVSIWDLTMKKLYIK